ncbi:polyamine-modulated factor 1 [Tanacetum coccineum]
MEKARKNELNKSFKVAVQGLLTTCSKQEFCKSFPSFTQAEQERLYNHYIQVIISLHENIEDEFTVLCQEVKVGDVLDTVDELVDKQTLDPLYPDKFEYDGTKLEAGKPTNIKDVARELVTSKKNEIQNLKDMLEQKEAQNKVLRSCVELLRKQIQDPSGASNALEKVNAGMQNNGTTNAVVFAVCHWAVSFALIVSLESDLGGIQLYFDVSFSLIAFGLSGLLKSNILPLPQPEDKRVKEEKKLGITQNLLLVQIDAT